MICFVAAMEKEIRPILARFSFREEAFGKISKLYHMEGRGCRFLLLVSGVGKGFAASALAAVLTRYGEQIDAVLNVGVGGSLNPSRAGLQSAIFGSAYLQYDMDTSAVGDPVGMLSGLNMIELPCDASLLQKAEAVCEQFGYAHAQGKIASGDTFVSSPSKIQEIQAKFSGILSVDMESAAYAQVCFCYEKPFLACRFVSDTGAAGEYEANFPACQQELTEFVCAYLGA